MGEGRLIGLVYYADDPAKQIFRKVYPQPDEDNSVLDDPVHVTVGCDPRRVAVMWKVAADSAEANLPMDGVP